MFLLVGQTAFGNFKVACRPTTVSSSSQNIERLARVISRDDAAGQKGAIRTLW